MRVRRRLADVSAQIRRLREQLEVLDEQVAHLHFVADNAGVEAAVGGPLAQRERRVAADDLRRALREREEAAGRLVALTTEQDGLLERLLDASA